MSDVTFCVMGADGVCVVDTDTRRDDSDTRRDDSDTRRDDSDTRRAAADRVLGKYTWDNAPPLFTMAGVELYAKVVRVYDGDTVNIVFEWGGDVVHRVLRLSGVDAPELRPRLDVAERAAKVASATAARDFLAARVLGQIVRVVFEREEKYGRLMGRVYVDTDVDVNAALIANGHAVSYDGGRKDM